MVTIEIIDTGEILEIVQPSVKYVKQVSDMGDISTQNSSYSTSMRIPKTPRNTMTLDGLGIIGDTSQMPYRKVYCRLLDNGVPIVLKGLLNIQETTDDYKAFVQEGIVEFFRDVSDDKIGEKIDLSALNHENDADTIIASFDNDRTYKYILADFNGVPRPLNKGTTDLDSTALVPSANIKWLLDRIFDHYGWTYKNLPDRVKDLWLTYPNALSYESAEGSENLIYRASMKTQSNGRVRDWQGPNTTLENGDYMQTLVFEWERSVMDSEFGEDSFWRSNNPPIIETTSFKVVKPGVYKVRWKVDGKIMIEIPFHKDVESDFYTRLLVNNQLVEGASAFTQTPETWGEATLDLGIGDIVTVFAAPPKIERIDARVESSVFEVYIAGVQEVDFSKALIKYKVKDFFKEIMMRFSLTPFPDVETKTITFMTLEERVNAPVTDWSKKYVDRISERYKYKTYGRNNFLRHKYNIDNADYADGNLKVQNENLEIEVDLFKSQTYAPEEENAIWSIGGGDFSVPRLKMFDVEIEIDDNGNVIGNYKGLKDRFFIIEETWVGKDIYIQGNRANGFPLAVKKTFKDVVASEYQETTRLLNDTRIHEIELALSKYDVQTMDLKKRYYFDEQKNFYIINKLNFVSDKTCIGEFIRVKNG